MVAGIDSGQIHSWSLQLMRVTSCPLGAAMMTPVALLSCENKRKFCAFQRSQWEPPEAAAQSLLSCVMEQQTMN